MTPPDTLRRFVVLEGLDGSGTTTQLRMLEERLKAAGIPHMATFEPSDLPVGRLIRDVLKGRVSVEPETLARLFTADRYEHLYGAGGMVAAVESGKVVLCDRYLFSSLAYQAVGAPFETVLELNRRFPVPELTVFIDVPPAVCRERRAARGGVELFEHDHLQDEILENYRRGFAAYPGARIVNVDGTVSADALCEKLWNLIADLPIL